MRTATDVIAFGLAMVADVALNVMPSDRVNAAANMLGKVHKYVETQQRHGEAAPGTEGKELRLLPTT